MQNLVPFLVVVGPLVVLTWLLGRRGGRREQHPLWPALFWTLAAAILVIAGTFGYNLNAADAMAAGTHWSDRVIWWELGVGFALVPVVAYSWRGGIRSFNSQSN
jgi:hypothetical protein